MCRFLLYIAYFVLFMFQCLINAFYVIYVCISYLCVNNELIQQENYRRHLGGT